MGKSTKKFKTEVQQLLELVIHSLYSNKEIFLRELVSNASDAIDRRRFESLSNKEILFDDATAQIKLSPDKDAHTLTITDTGIGMSREEVEKNIGTIASSGTKAFLQELKAANAAGNPDMIGQFGVGFYSAFMVADKVSLVTRRADQPADSATSWTSTGDGSYTVNDATKDEPGTEIVLHLKNQVVIESDDDEDNDPADTSDFGEYLDEWKLRKVVKQYSDFVEYPVVMDITREEQPKDEEGNIIEGEDAVVTVDTQTLNSQKALWTRPKSEIKDDEYKDFYRHISHNYDEPSEIIHFTAEGMVEFTALLYLPSTAPMDLYMPEQSRRGIHLFVKRVFIMDDCKELVPEYLRFVKGVVQCNDLPLNVSRELLQEDAMVKRIQRNLTTKILSTLKKMKTKQNDKYLAFYQEFGKILKEGLHFDTTNRDKLQELVLFESSMTEAGVLTDLREVRNRMPEDQKAIYYITGDSRTAVEASPHLEVFKKKSYEVLYLTDAIDEWVIQALTEYDGMQLQPVDRGDLELGDDAESKEKLDAAGETHKDLLTYVKEHLGEDVEEVRFSNRLTDSPSCLVAGEGGMNAHMERIFKSMNQDVPASKRVFELNPDHALVGIMDGLLGADNKDKLGDYVDLLYNQALLSGGSDLKDAQRFAKLVGELMVFQGETLQA